MTEETQVRSESPELEAMLLPQLQQVATQLGIEGAQKMKKSALVTAISELQATNRESAKAEREAARAEREARADQHAALRARGERGCRSRRQARHRQG